MENKNQSVSRTFFSYCLYPDIDFETYEQGERIVLLLRSHPFTQLYIGVNTALFVLLLVVVNLVLGQIFSFGQTFLLNCFGILAILSYIWFCFLNWYFNVGIVTSRRVIDIDFDSVLYKEVTSARLDKIEDITVKTGGYIESFFDFGTILIQTAATSEANVVFDTVPHPTDVIEAINKLLGRRHA